MFLSNHLDLLLLYLFFNLFALENTELSRNVAILLLKRVIRTDGGGISSKFRIKKQSTGRYFELFSGSFKFCLYHYLNNFVQIIKLQCHYLAEKIPGLTNHLVCLFTLKLGILYKL